MLKSNMGTMRFMNIPGLGFFAVFLELFFILFSNSGDAEELPLVDEVVVVAPESGRFLRSIAAETTVITAAEIEKMQVETIPELLETLSSARISERGTPGSQADISMRGSSTEGVLLLIDGVRVSDPQTGHFLMDIPVALDGVERVEVLSGGGSTLYGSSATGGIVNIVTREGSRPRGGFSIGSFGSMKADGSLSISGGRSSAAVNARWGRSDGYTEGTDLEYALADGSGRWSAGDWNMRWNGGVLHKSFGAKGFYGEYPSFEEVTTVQGGMHAVRTLDDRSLFRLRLGARGHGDEFTLDRYQPALYRNTHFNRSFLLGGEFIRSGAGGRSLTVGAEAGRAGITSGKLGNHGDNSAALYGDYAGKAGPGGWSVSLRYDRGYKDERVFSPAVGIAVPFGKKYRMRFRVERSFRSPTYTELYYNDPANIGNPDLRSERSLSAETGIDRKTASGETSLNVFTMRTSRCIDWVRDPGESAWFAANHGRIRTIGAEGRYSAYLAEEWNFTGGCTLLRQDVRDRKGRESKYALYTAVRTVVATLCGPLPLGLMCALSARHERMRDGDTRTPVDVRFSRRFGAALAGISARNIGNERYEEIPGLRAPGRWFTLKMEYAR